MFRLPCLNLNDSTNVLNSLLITNNQCKNKQTNKLKNQCTKMLYLLHINVDLEREGRVVVPHILKRFKLSSLPL
jgi:hypothetical protein